MSFSVRSSGIVLMGVIAAVVSGAGCASKTASARFDQVQQTVADRTGEQVFWNTNSDDDARADAAVGQLLGRELTADSAAQTALLNNRGLQATFEDIGVTQAELVRAGLLKNPVFNAGYEFASGGGLAKVNLSVTEDFLNILRIPLQKRVAGDALEAARTEAANAALTLTADVRTAFYEYQAAQQILSLRRSTSGSKKAAADMADRLHGAGNLSDLDLANEQAMEGQSVLETTAAEAEVTEKREHLNELMGLSGARADAWKSAEKLPDVPPKQAAPKNLEALALEQRLDLAAAMHQAQQAADELGIARQFALLPDASAGASAEREHEGEWETGPEISVPIPLFDLGGPSVARARAKLRQAQRRFEAMSVQVRSEVRRAQNRMNEASEAAGCYRETVLPLRQRIVDQTMLRYDGMLASVFQLLSAKDAQLEAEAGYIKATRDFWIASAELERAVGGSPDKGKDDKVTR